MSKEVQKVTLKDTNGNEYEMITKPEKIHVRKHIESLNNTITNLKNKLEIKDNNLSMIVQIAIDYDGCNTVEQFKELVDELVEFARKGLNNEDIEYMVEFIKEAK